MPSPSSDTCYTCSKVSNNNTFVARLLARTPLRCIHYFNCINFLVSNFCDTISKKKWKRERDCRRNWFKNEQKVFVKNMFHRIVTIIAYNLTHSTMQNRQADRAISYLTYRRKKHDPISYFFMCVSRRFQWILI